MKDKVDGLGFHQLAMQLWDECWNDTETLMRDSRGKEIARHLIRSVGSISANIEEGYGRGYGKEYPRFLKIARGSARKSKGWYNKSKFLLDQERINDRVNLLNSIIIMLTRAIGIIENDRWRSR